MTSLLLTLIPLWFALSIGAFVVVGMSERHRRLRRGRPVARVTVRPHLRSAA